MEEQGRQRPAPRTRPAFAREHWVFLVVLAAGAVLRMFAFIAYQPAILYLDSFRYLANLIALDPSQLDPIGYDLVLRVLLPFGGLRTVTGVQHLAGLLLGCAVYALALRYGARRWLAAIAAVPVLLDAYQVQIEQNVMSDVWLQLLLVAVVWVLAARGAPTPKRAGAAGLLLGLAAIMRTIAIPLVLPLLGYLIIAGGVWRGREGRRIIAVRSVAMLSCFGLVLFCYAGYFHRETGEWGLDGASSGVLYGRTANVADCPALHLPPSLQQLCPTEPLTARKGVDWYAHLIGDPGFPAFVPLGKTVEELQRQFAIQVIEAQPGAVAKAVLGDFAKGFEPGRTTSPGDVPVQRWQFQTFYPLWSLDESSVWNIAMYYGGVPPSVHNDLAAVLRAYQLDGGYTPGPLQAIFALLGLIGGFGFGRRRSGIRAMTLLTTGFGLVILFASAMFEFSWRYQLPGLVLLPLGGVLGMTVLMGPLKRPAAKSRRSMLSAFPDQADWSAMTDFTDRYGAPDFAPVLVVIAAYNEEGGIGGVLDDLPKECCGLPVDVLVVIDGCSDDTATVAAEHGAYTCVAPANRGQGAALRLGYQLAALGGAEYVVTTDADGQYCNAEMPMLLRPLIDDEADFTTGSRRLGVAPGDDRVRWLGVRVFATLASILTARRITDTSFGFRGMRTSLACSVELRQPQYQASELLISALAGGARLLELPMTMRVRSAGTTKKGNNFVYGMNYSKVMTRTWVREFVVGRLTRRLRPMVSAGAPSADQAART
ncbi:MAG TPA: glycosyltransferase family 2 protein [Pseudonocardiaceae bacterium]|nr:glycosyltransferase family 2 protein [Pseudonocardiaceae bacterium]